MIRPVAFRPVARLEYADAMAWYEVRQEGLGFAFEGEVEQFIRRIASDPEEFPVIRPDIRRAVLHRFPFVIHFTVEETQIVVLAVFHAKRDPSRLEGRD